MGKQGVTIDWTKPDGMTALRGLVEGADVLIDDWAPQTRKGLGLSFPQLADLNGSLLLWTAPPGAHIPSEHPVYRALVFVRAAKILLKESS